MTAVEFFSIFDWPHALLLGGATLGGLLVGIGILKESERWSIAAIMVLTGVIIEPVFTLGLFVYDEHVGRQQNERIIALQARPWTKEAFDAIQAIKGKVTDVGVSPEKGCLECRLFASDISLALHAAGAQLYEDPSLDWMSGTGIMVWLPEGSDLTNHPLVAALREAGLNPGAARHNPGNWSPVRTDIPVIFVGEKYPQYPRFPYSPGGQSRWTIGPLKNPAFVPPDPAAIRPTNQMHFQTGEPKE